tara:strand:+ start:1448 stop:2242 length:795 start_codon:yes stop_codon:yes gene_type:complete
MQDFLNVEKVQGSIIRLTMNDDKTGNALSDYMISALDSMIKEISTDKLIKVVVIASTGKIFCSGHNLKEITAARKNNDQGESYFKDLFESCSLLMQSIVNCPKPVIAEVDGIATAAGCQLVASCDLAIASDISSFATPGVNLGLFCSTPMVALSRNVKKKDAMKMLLTGDMIDSSEAKRISLINDHVPSKNLSTEVMKLASKIASKSMQTVKIGKSAFYKQAELSLSQAYKFTSEIMAENTLNDDAKEGISSFLEKRDPNWRDS